MKSKVPRFLNLTTRRNCDGIKEREGELMDSEDEEVHAGSLLLKLTKIIHIT